MVPLLSVEPSVKFAVRPLVVKVKLATGGALVLPPAASTRALASMMPAPQPPEQAPDSGYAVAFSEASTWAGVYRARPSARRRLCASATAPATCGDAIEVPLYD